MVRVDIWPDLERMALQRRSILSYSFAALVAVWSTDPVLSDTVRANADFIIPVSFSYFIPNYRLTGLYKLFLDWISAIPESETSSLHTLQPFVYAVSGNLFQCTGSLIRPHLPRILRYLHRDIRTQESHNRTTTALTALASAAYSAGPFFEAHLSTTMEILTNLMGFISRLTKDVCRALFLSLIQVFGSVGAIRFRPYIKRTVRCAIAAFEGDMRGIRVCFLVSLVKDYTTRDLQEIYPGPEMIQLVMELLEFVVCTLESTLEDDMIKSWGESPLALVL